MELKEKKRRGQNETLKPPMPRGLVGLQEEIAKKQAERVAGILWTAEDRWGDAYIQELAKQSLDRIGGTEKEKRQFFDEALAPYGDVYWFEGCPAPTVRSKLVHFSLKPGAVPKARQPISLTPYDDLRVEFHIEETCMKESCGR